MRLHACGSVFYVCARACVWMSVNAHVYMHVHGHVVGEYARVCVYVCCWFPWHASFFTSAAHFVLVTGQRRIAL